MSDKADKVTEQASKIIKVRITITSTNVKSIEKVSEDIVSRSKQSEVFTKGPVRLPTKVLKITTRKTPNGEGSKTWDSYEMRIHKRLIDIQSPIDVIKRITAYNMVPGVNIDVTVAN
ncbi:40S ribosomal protein S20 [Wickerhamiella sorbophila]|uniref:Small ribosomal subunit protein uS10 n=1 Tax=Wickerhamiella sorbophila TaxID=45607 RepID=A0A2T0FDI6_9ASCO|nr:40S ribosomal protein S20 [Wickerhamiella sorbophila]PRT53027.1 40S ribosomal protein S20 [Wickerhamiella sorbophila]